MMKSIYPGLLLLLASISHAGDVEIVNAEAIKSANNSYSFQVTLQHGDTGWDHYADQWQVFTSDGKLLGTRTLYHPHVEEQPFTRSLGNVKIPAGITSVQVKARDKVHGVSPKSFTVELPQ